jgi:hypothetical protein
MIKDSNAMRISRFVLAAMLTFAAAASGHADDSSDVALNLGSVIGSEEACGLTYDQDAIERFINEHVKASDMSFPSMLNTMTAGTKFQIENMSKSSLTAHCAQVRRIAVKYGFTK